MLLLIVASWCMLACGIVWLCLGDDPQSVRYFFGNIFVDTPPTADSFFRFKLVLYVVGVVFAFLAPILVLTNTAVGEAPKRAVKAALTNIPLLILSLVISIGFEYLMNKMPALGMPGVALSLMALILFIMWGFAFAYTTSIRVLNLR